MTMAPYTPDDGTFLLVHTMTVNGHAFTLNAQYIHAVDGELLTSRLLGTLVNLTVRVRFPGGLRRPFKARRPILSRNMKASAITHRLRTLRISSSQIQLPQSSDEVLALPNTSSQNEVKDEQMNEMPTQNFKPDQLSANSTPQETATWLSQNRFERYLQTFNNFCGADMLRMSRDDLGQICGQADGIRLYNALHSKTIIPKLTIYVSREDTPVYNAVFLSSFNNIELVQKLASLFGIPTNQVRDIYIEGPQGIRIQLNSEMIRHIKEETMYKVKIINDNGCYLLVLKPTVK